MRSAWYGGRRRPEAPAPPFSASGHRQRRSHEPVSSDPQCSVRWCRPRRNHVAAIGFRCGEGHHGGRGRERSHDGARHPCRRGHGRTGRHRPLRLRNQGAVPGWFGRPQGFGGPADGRGLRSARCPGSRRHGRGLQGTAARPETHRRPEDDPGRPARQRSRPGPLPQRGRSGRSTPAPQHRPALRGRRGRGPALLLSRICGRAQPRQDNPGDAGAAAGSCPPGSEARRGHGLRPPARGHPPRPEAGQHPPAEEIRITNSEIRPRLLGSCFGFRSWDFGFGAEDHRLRTRQARRGPFGTDGQRCHPGHALVHGPGAGRGQDPRGRPACRRLRPGCHPLRTAHRQGALPRSDLPGHPPASAHPGAGPPDPTPARRAARSGDNLSDLSAKGAGQALRQRRRPGGGPAPLPGRRADPGPSRPAESSGCGAGAAESCRTTTSTWAARCWRWGNRPRRAPSSRRP